VPDRAHALSRRAFLKWGAAAGVTSAVAGMGILSALGVVKGPTEPPPAWEVEPGVVDYSRVPRAPSGPTPYVLKVAQWYDYWPGEFIVSFEDYILSRYGHRIEIQWDVYTSNEELFHLLTLGRRRYDVIGPSNYLVDLMKKANMIYTLNPDWLPNVGGPSFSNMFEDLVNKPAGNPYDRRPTADFGWQWVSAPYFWGTTGIGFRTDRIPKDEAKELGYDLLWSPSYTPRAPGYPTLDLRKKMRMLDDMRDVIGAGLKKAGWEWQKGQGLTPTGLFPPSGPQWTTNEEDPQKIRSAGEWLFRQKPLLFGYNSTDQSTSLITQSAYVNQAWSGDMMYAIRPDQGIEQNVDYIIPPQGSTWWVDCVAIHSKSRNLWLAHEFINFIHDTAQNVLLTNWNLYSTPNRPCFESLQPFANGYDMREDPRLYPNLLAPEDFRICDFSQDVGLDTMLKLYNPLWFDLATV